MWGEISQVLEAEVSKTPMFYPEGIKKSKGDFLKFQGRTLTTQEPIPTTINIPEGYETEVFIKV